MQCYCPSLKYAANSIVINSGYYFFSENSPPVIRNSDCDVNCSLCKSRDSDLSDRCNIRSTSGKKFYAMVVAHKDYRNATIVFDGQNLQNVTHFDGWARQNFWNNNLLFVLNWFAEISFAWYLTFQNIEQEKNQLLKIPNLSKLIKYY